MAFSDAEILEHLGMATTPETSNENESETGKPNVALADRHLDWLLSGHDDDSETESGPFIGKGKGKPGPQ